MAIREPEYSYIVLRQERDEDVEELQLETEEVEVEALVLKYL